MKGNEINDLNTLCNIKLQTTLYQKPSITVRLLHKPLFVEIAAAHPVLLADGGGRLTLEQGEDSQQALGLL